MEYYRIEFFKLTDDEWYPSFKTKNEKLVHIVFGNTLNYWIIIVGGDDDYYICKRYDNEGTARTELMNILELEKVNYQYLKDLGFNYE